MSPEIKVILVKRAKSLVWRIVMMGCAILLAEVVKDLQLFHLSPEIVGLLGLGLGELSKFINSKLPGDLPDALVAEIADRP